MDKANGLTNTAIPIEVMQNDDGDNAGVEICSNPHSIVENNGRTSSPQGRKRSPPTDPSSDSSEYSNASANNKKRAKSDDVEDTDDEVASEGEQEEGESIEEGHADDSGVSGLSQNSKWEIMFDRLVKYKEVNGDCLVRNRYNEDAKLGSWVSTQRRQYKAVGTGKMNATTLPQHRIDRLESIGFVWVTPDPRRVAWEVRYKQLCQFKRKFGNSVVPMGYEDNVSLANWVSVQRQEYKNLLQRKPSKMTSKRIKLLNAVDFVWKAPRGARRKQDRGRSGILPKAVQHPSYGHKHRTTTTNDSAQETDDEDAIEVAVQDSSSEQASVSLAATAPRGASVPKSSRPSSSSTSTSRGVQFPFPDVTSNAPAQHITGGCPTNAMALGNPSQIFQNLSDPAGILRIHPALGFPHQLPPYAQTSTALFNPLALTGNYFAHSISTYQQHLLASSAASASMYEQALVSALTPPRPALDMSMLTAVPLLLPQSRPSAISILAESHRPADRLLAQQMGTGAARRRTLADYLSNPDV